MMDFIIYVGLGILIYVLYQKFARRNLPPRPVPWPVIGNLIELARADGLPYEALSAMSKKYGNVFSLMVGVVPTVMVNGHDQVRAVFKNEDFDNRIQYDWILDRNYGKPQGIFIGISNSWKETRRLTAKIMKEFGFGQGATMEGFILEEFNEFIQKLKEKVEENDVVLIDNTFIGPMTNVVWSLLTGHRFNLDDPEYTELIDALAGFGHSQQVGGTQLLGAFPFLAKLAPKMSGFAEIHRCNAKLLDYFERVLKKYRDKGTYKTNPIDPIDAFLAEINNNQDSSNPVYTDQNLVSVINDLFAAGSDTSGQTVAFMVQYPEIQRKVRDEIDKVMDTKNEMVNCGDKPQLPYTEATILEVFRFALVAPIAPRTALKSCRLGSYEISQGTTVCCDKYLQCSGAHRDESVLGDPENFRPERFLNADSEIVNSEKLFTFGSGKRNCIGEVTARTSVFIALSNLIRNFVFEADPKTGVPTTENIMGLACAPKPYRVRVKIRKNVL